MIQAAIVNIITGTRVGLGLSGTEIHISSKWALAGNLVNILAEITSVQFYNTRACRHHNAAFVSNGNVSPGSLSAE